MKRIAATAAVATVIAASLAAPAQAIAPYQPDAMINPAMVGWVGNDVVGTDPALQEAYLGIPPGGVARFEVAVENDGAFGDTFRIQGCDSRRGYKVRYATGGANVTPHAVAGTLSTSLIASGDTSTPIVLKIRATADARPKFYCPITVSSTNSPANTDAIRAWVERLG